MRIYKVAESTAVAQGFSAGKKKSRQLHPEPPLPWPERAERLCPSRSQMPDRSGRTGSFPMRLPQLEAMSGLTEAMVSTPDAGFVKIRCERHENRRRLLKK